MIPSSCGPNLIFPVKKKQIPNPILSLSFRPLLNGYSKVGQTGSGTVNMPILPRHLLEGSFEIAVRMRTSVRYVARTSRLRL